VSRVPVKYVDDLKPFVRLEVGVPATPLRAPGSPAQLAEAEFGEVVVKSVAGGA
jgi:hypothetical protein